MFADLHIHTQFSDGTLTPKEVVEKAKRLDIGIISICDHDNLAAYPQLDKLCDEHEIKLINGVEIEANWKEHTLHILAYGFDSLNENFTKMLHKSKHELEQISVDMVEKMQKDYSHIGLEDYSNYDYLPTSGGWKGINYLKDRGLTENLVDGMNFHRKYGGFIPEFYHINEVCKIVKSAGGFPVLAHPGNWWSDIPENFYTILVDLLDYGISGIECFYPSHSEKLTKICVDFCNEHNLLITAGSDEHGEFNKVINGVTYEMGEIMVDIEKLNLKGLV